MNLSRNLACAVLLLVASPAFGAGLADFKGYADPALFTRMPGAFLSGVGAYKESAFDAYDFPVKNGAKVEKVRVEGRKTVYTYSFDRAAGPVPSGLQVKRNYQAAAKRIGGEVLHDSDGAYMNTTLRIPKDGRETWVEVLTRAATYYVTIVERQEMKQDVVANADALKGGLARTGHVEVPGIFFDFGKADVKPESEPALREVAKLLQASPGLRVWVVGHTDSVGSAEDNVALASGRAASVVAWLTGKLSVDGKRLVPHGVGPYAPVASNATDEGRAKNRRVELVEIR
ncbi:MAG TPA: OmpA family protein [Thermoanaerobaculia bacterium]|nr:OmpA family protein [Thermoanaerobaculia bacterium]